MLNKLEPIGSSLFVVHVKSLGRLLYSSWVIRVGYDFQVIGSRIRQAREAKGITQEMLARAMSVSNVYISKIERGKTPINLDNLSKICDMLDATVEYLLTGASTSASNYMQNEIMNMLQGCSPEKIRLIARVIKPIVDDNGQHD